MSTDMFQLPKDTCIFVTDKDNAIWRISPINATNTVLYESIELICDPASGGVIVSSKNVHTTGSRKFFVDCLEGKLKRYIPSEVYLDMSRNMFWKFRHFKGNDYDIDSIDKETISYKRAIDATTWTRDRHEFCGFVFRNGYWEPRFANVSTRKTSARDFLY